MADETVILRVQLDEGKTTDRLKQLTLDIEKNREAQKSLTAARKANTVSDEEYSKQNVDLQQKMRAARTEQTALTKNLELYTRAVKGVGTSYDATQAQLSLAQKQYQLLAGSAENSTEETQALSKIIDELRGTLKSTDAGMGLFVRNVGNYSGAIEPLIAELKRLEVQQTKLGEADPGAAARQTQIMGFQQRINQAGAEAGLTYEQTQAKLKDYGDSIEPVVQQLVQLEQEQTKVVEGSEEYTKIGFRIQALKKDISEVPEENGKLIDSLEVVDQVTGAFGGQVSRLKGAWEQAVVGAKAMQLGLTGVKAAFAATGIGLFIIALGLLYEYFTKTDEGQEDFAAGLAYLKGLFSVLEGAAITLGKGLALMFTDPKKAATDFATFIGNNLLNRVKAFGVLWDSIKNGDVSKLNDAVIQFTTGIENGTAKTKALTDEMKRAADAAYNISRAQDQLDDAQRNSLVLLEQNKNLVDKLVLSARDRTLSEKQRLANLDEASRLETESLNTTIRLAQDKLAIAYATNAEARKAGTISDEQRQALVDAQVTLVRLAGQSASLQQSIANRRSVLIQTELAEEKAKRDKAAADEAKRQEKALADRRAQLKLANDLLDLELRKVAENSDEELSLLQRKLTNSYKIELAQKDLTIGQKKLLDKKYQADSDELFLSAIRRRALTALQVEANGIAVRLTQVKLGSDEEVAIQAEAIEKQRQQELAAIGERVQGDARASQEQLINARAVQQTEELTYQSRLKAVQTFYQQQRNELETARAKGEVTEQQYQDQLFQQQLGAAAAVRQLNQQTNRDTAAQDQELTDLKIQHLQQVVDKDRETAQKRADIAQDFGAALGQIFADTITDAGASLEDFAQKSLLLILDTLSKTLIAAQIKIITESLASAESIATFGVAGFVKAGLIIGALTAATGVLKSTLSSPAPKRFAQGTVLEGPSHAVGGIGLYSPNGHFFGEAEGGEPVLTKGVSRNPSLLAAASAINVAAGGRPLVAGLHTMPKLALGGITKQMVRDSVNSGVEPLDYDRLAGALTKVNIYTKTQETMQSIDKVKYTEQMGSD